MRKIAFAAAALALTSSAYAADMPLLKALPMVAAPTWTGWYVGGNIGAGWSSSANPAVSFTDPGSAVNFGPFGAAGGFQFPNLAPKGLVGGAQIGYDWQVNSWAVLGAVADFQASSMGASGTVTVPPFSGFVGTTQALSAQENWLGTVRARLGVLATPNWLIYASGGLAYGSVSSTLNFGFPLPNATSFINSQTSTNTGWAAGGGFEYKVSGTPFSLGFDYLHFDLGSSAVTATGIATATGLPRFPGASLSVNQNFAGNIARAVVNYRF